MLEVFIDSLLDSLKIFGFALITYILVSFIIRPLCIKLTNRKTSTLIGTLSGIFPECAIPIISSNLYCKKLITYGSLIAIFLASSDEAIIVLASSNNWITIGYLILFKVIIALIFGYLIDLLYYKQQLNDINDYHDISSNNKLEAHLIHPLIDALKIFFYAFIIIFIFGTIVYFIGKDNIIKFINDNRNLEVITASLVGLIPNCSGSIILTTLYLEGGLEFSALLAGLLVNSGIGLLFLFKNGKIKLGIITIIILLIISITCGYILFSLGY